MERKMKVIFLDVDGVLNSDEYMDKIKSAFARLCPSKAAVISGGAAFMIILVLIDPTTYLQSALVGLELFGTKVAPALFPFFFFAGILTRCGFAEGMGRLLRRPAKLLYRVPGCGGYVWCMSILSGYPVGAKLTRELYDGALTDAAGIYFEDEIYNIDERLAAEYDKNFPPKEIVLGTPTQKKFEMMVKRVRPYRV